MTWQTCFTFAGVFQIFTVFPFSSSTADFEIFDMSTKLITLLQLQHEDMFRIGFVNSKYIAFFSNKEPKTTALLT